MSTTDDTLERAVDAEHPEVPPDAAPIVPEGPPPPESAPAAIIPPAAEVAPGSHETRPLVTPRVLSADAVPDADLLGRSAHAALLAELILHRGAETPFCVGVLGAAGSGRSSFATQIVAAVEALASEAAQAGLASAFVSDVTVVHLDPSGDGEPDTLLAEAVLARLGRTHPALAAGLAHAGADRLARVLSASETLDGLRRELDAERQALDALRARVAGLHDAATETAGSHLDVYARAHRGRIEHALRPFGLAGRDATVSFKGLVRDAAEGAESRLGLSLRALYAFKGQARLLAGAMVFGLVAWACSALREDTGWIETVRGAHERAAPVADWIAAHLWWLGTVETAALGLGFVLLVMNVLRAGRFMLLLSRGVDLLHAEVDSRRRELTGALAHQTRRADALAAEVEAASARLAEAERHAEPAEPHARRALSRPAAFFEALADAAGRTPEAPGRVLVTIDGLDADPVRGAAMLAAVQRLAGPGVVTLAVADPDRLASGWSGAPSIGLARCVQVPFRLDGPGGREVGRRNYALALLGQGGMPSRPIRPDPRRSVLDRDWTVSETEIVAALAPLAGDAPRDVKRLVNLYCVARADPRLAVAPRPVLAALALALALDQRGGPDDAAALEQGRKGAAASDAPALSAVLTTLRKLTGDTVDVAAAKQGFTVASDYSTRTPAPAEPWGQSPPDEQQSRPSRRAAGPRQRSTG